MSRSVSADMFGLALRTYLRKIQRLRESSTEHGKSLWEAVLDDDVQVAMFTTAPLPSYDPTFSNSKFPKWDGSDVFAIDARTVTNGDPNAPKAVDQHACVTGSTLVASFGAMTQHMVIGLTATQIRLSLNLQEAILVCDISPAQTAPAASMLHCTLAGRWARDDLLHQLSAFPEPTDVGRSRALCTTSASYPTFNELICSDPDISVSPSTAPRGICDALSFGITFDMSPATLGDVETVNTPSSACEGNVDPVNDSCES